MARTFIDVEPSAFSSLAADACVELFTRLLWSSANLHRVPIDTITITAKINVADGGIDAEIRPNTVQPNQDLLLSGNSFFQIKAGTSATPWQKAWLRRELMGTSPKRSPNALGAAVRHCLEQEGRYVLVCFGVDPTGQQRRAAIRSIREIFASCGFRNASVDVWGQSTLSGLVQRFPSLVLRLANRHNLPFLTHEEWQHDAAMSVALHLGKPQQAVIEEIRKCLRGNEVHHVRFIGEPGLGKTRLALEALAAPDLASSVVYVRNPEDFERSPLFTSLLRADDQSSVILVVDDCPEKDRASIWNALRQRSDRIRLVTLDHGPESSHDQLMRVIYCPLLEQDQIKGILREYVGSNGDLDRWASFCSGSPRVAHAVGDNLRSNPEDILKPTATVPIWERFIHGNTRAGTAEEAQHELVLRHIALFHKFGFEPPVEDEAKFIAGLAAQADPTLTWAKFQSIVKHFRDRRILQGKTTLFLVPRALHVHLWLQFWDHYGSGTRVPDLLAQMPESLFRWFAEMFKYGHASEKCLARIEELTNRGGPFDDPEFIKTRKGAEFLNELAEAHPEAVLRCIERTVAQWSQEELLAFSQSRQYIVWALEKIAIWKGMFQRAAMSLVALARAENASNSNNATGTFCGLFQMGFDRMASSEAPPALRLPVLKQLLGAPDERTRAIALRALGNALDDHPHSRMVGPEHQGIRPPPKLWTPKTWGEVHDAYREAWKVAVKFWRDSQGEERTKAAKELCDASFNLLRRQALEQDVLDGLEELSRDRRSDLRPLVQFLARYRRLRWKSLSRKAAAGLRRIEKTLEGGDLESQIVRAVLLGTWDDLDRSDKGPYGKMHAEKLRRLARQFSNKPALIKRLLPRLVSESGLSLAQFGSSLGSTDKSLALWSQFRAAFIEAGDKRNPELLTGYLSGLFARAKREWETVVLKLLDDDLVQKYARSLVIPSGMTDSVLDRLCYLIEQGTLADETLDHFAYARNRDPTSLDRCLRFISWCLALSRPLLIRSALETAYGIFCFDKDPPPLPEQPILNLITSSNVLQDRNHTSFQWSELTDNYVEAFPQHAMRIFESVLLKFADHDFLLQVEHSQAQQTLMKLVGHNPTAAWKIVTQLMADPTENRAWHVAHWLGPGYAFDDRSTTGPLAAFEAEDVMAWVEENPSERAHFIAGECPKTLDPNDGALTRQMLIRYGDQEDVRDALWAAFGTEGWSGRASEHYRKKRDQMRQWLSTETELSIISWIENYIDYLNRRVKESEIREEREF